MTEISEWKDLPTEIEKIPKEATLRLIVWSVPREKDVQGAD